MKKGLILEGGAMRGLFTMGIIDVFMENGIDFDGACGVSAGVAFGCNIKSRQIGRVIRYNKRFNREWRFKSFRSLFVTGDLYGGKFCYHTLPDELDIFDYETFRNNPMEFWCVTTDVDSGKPCYHLLKSGDYDDLEWIRASASMPLASKIVKVKMDDGSEGLMLDGGVSDSIPLKFFESQGYDKNIVILTQPSGYVKKPYKIMPVARLLLHKHKGIIEALDNRPDMYNSQTRYVEEREKSGDVFVIRPPEALNIGALERDTNEMDRVYNLGRQTALEKLQEIKDFLN